MKAISVRQPWAWAIISALKDIENRGWPIHYRGDILIHAAKTCTKKEYQLAKEFCQGMGVVIPELKGNQGRYYRLYQKCENQKAITKIRWGAKILRTQN